jgi:hypothetical protein
MWIRVSALNLRRLFRALNLALDLRYQRVVCSQVGQSIGRAGNNTVSRGRQGGAKSAAGSRFERRKGMLPAIHTSHWIPEVNRIVHCVELDEKMWPGRRRVRSSSCFQASVKSLEDRHPDDFWESFRASGVFNSSINQLRIHRMPKNRRRVSR